MKNSEKALTGWQSGIVGLQEQKKICNRCFRVDLVEIQTTNSKGKRTPDYKNVKHDFTVEVRAFTTLIGRSKYTEQTKYRDIRETIKIAIKHALDKEKCEHPYWEREELSDAHVVIAAAVRTTMRVLPDDLNIWKGELSKVREWNDSKIDALLICLLHSCDGSSG